jgi:hypothetical protein
MKKLLCVAPLVALAIACSPGEEPASPGTYTIQFPSTAAAVATDTVQLLFYDLPKSQAERTALCAVLIQTRKSGELPKPAFQNQPVNICEMSQGRRPVTVQYGERAVFAIAQRRGADFMFGCSIQTFGEGDAPLPISMALVDVTNAVPETTCATVSDFCTLKCPAQ